MEVKDIVKFKEGTEQDSLYAVDEVVNNNILKDVVVAYLIKGNGFTIRETRIEVPSNTLEKVGQIDNKGVIEWL